MYFTGRFTSLLQTD